MLKRLFQRSRGAPDEAPTVNGRPARLPEGVRVYAIGDVHGRIDLLQQLERTITQDIELSGECLDHLLVYVGDYVDRGFHSREVLDHLTLPHHDGPRRVYLLGNHDAWLRDYLSDQEVTPAWLRFGGDATLASYGVTIDPTESEERVLEAAKPILKERLPERHRTFLEELEVAFSLGDYFFCHAGIRPNTALSAQTVEDLTWIREPFLDWRGDAGKVVVHGHTIEPQPALRRNRIGIDTGAYSTGVLTCVVLEGRMQRFLSTQPGMSI